MSMFCLMINNMASKMLLALLQKNWLTTHIGHSQTHLVQLVVRIFVLDFSFQGHCDHQWLMRAAFLCVFDLARMSQIDTRAGRWTVDGAPDAPDVTRSKHGFLRRGVLRQPGGARGPDEDGPQHGARGPRQLPVGSAGARRGAPAHQPPQAGSCHGVRHLQCGGTCIRTDGECFL